MVGIIVLSISAALFVGIVIYELVSHNGWIDITRDKFITIEGFLFILSVLGIICGIVFSFLT